jgi:hypothetical protein
MPIALLTYMITSPSEAMKLYISDPNFIIYRESFLDVIYQSKRP